MAGVMASASVAAEFFIVSEAKAKLLIGGRPTPAASTESRAEPWVAIQPQKAGQSAAQDVAGRRRDEEAQQ
jgi:hypothetical protein